MQAARSPDRAARINRIKSRGCPEIIQALNRGGLGIKTLERISRLPVSKQSIELVRCLEARKANAQRQATWRANPRAGKTPFASQSYAEARARRLRRIERRATTELKAAYEEGRLSLRAYDLLSRLPAGQQRKTVKSDRYKEHAQTLAAAAIKRLLAQKPQRVDLALLTSQIISAIRASLRST